MALSSIPERNSRTEIPKPLMLKDFLRENSMQVRSRVKPQEHATTVKHLLEMESRTHKDRKTAVLSRSRSRAASAFQSVIGIVKLFPFSTKASSPRSLSRSFSKRFTMRSFSSRNRENEQECEIKVRVKDIMRWKSFGDEEINLAQSLCNSSGNCRSMKTSERTLDRCSPCSSSSSNSTWSHSSASSECSCDGTDHVAGDKNLLLHGSKTPNFSLFSPEMESFVEATCAEESAAGERAELEVSAKLDSMETATCYQEEEENQLAECEFEEKEQFSPVSVLDFPDEEEDEENSSFEQSLANMERTKCQLLQKLLRFETLANLDSLDLENTMTSLESELSGEDSDHNLDDREEDVSDIEAAACSPCVDKAGDLHIFFKASFESSTEKLDRFVLDVGGSWEKKSWLIGLRGEEERQNDWIKGRGSMVGHKENDKEACIKEMEKNDGWRKFEEEKEEMVMEMESGVLGLLVEEILLDLMDRQWDQTIAV